MEIKINKIEQKIGQTSGKPWWALETSKGKMSCHEKDIADELWEAWQKGMICYVDAIPSKDGKYVNIRKRFIGPEENDAYEEANRNYGAINPVNPADMGTQWDGKPQDLGKPVLVKDCNTPEFNPTSMYVSYAKDIFCSLMTGYYSDDTPTDSSVVMNDAINLVKQAHKEFTI